MDYLMNRGMIQNGFNVVRVRDGLRTSCDWKCILVATVYLNLSYSMTGYVPKSGRYTHGDVPLSIGLLTQLILVSLCLHLYNILRALYRIAILQGKKSGRGTKDHSGSMGRVRCA
jgi:hypothetical protein